VPPEIAAAPQRPAITIADAPAAGGGRRAWLRRLGPVAWLVLAVVPYFLAPSWQLEWAFGAIYALVGLSLKPVVARLGQVSLGHQAVVAIGGFSAATLMAKHGVPFVPAALAGIAAGAAVAAVLGGIALRLRGLHLALVTLTFGLTMSASLFELRPFSGGGEGLIVNRPPWLSGNYAVYLLALAAVMAAWWMDRQLERTKLGRAADAVRQDIAVAQTFGINPLASMLAVFVLSGAIAGFAGTLWAMWAQFMHADSFAYQMGLLILMMVVVPNPQSRLIVAINGVFFGVFADVLQNIPGLVDAVGVTKIALFLPIIVGPMVVGALIHFTALESRPGSGAARMPGAPTVLEDMSSLESLPVAGADAAAEDPARPALQLSNVSMRFGGLQALSQVSFTVGRGRIVGLVGPNGAGKTTLFNCVSGLQGGWSGEIRIAGRSAAELPAHARARLRVGRTFQHVGLLKENSVFDNLLAARHLRTRYRGIGGLLPTPHARREEAASRAAAEELVSKLGLAAIRDLPIRSLPYGTMRLVELTCVLAMNPSLLMLDEPSSGMSAAESKALGVWLRRIRDHFDLTILIIEHHVPLIASLCDEVHVLEFGRVIASGTPEAISADPAVIEAFLGTAHT
jgi:ABC-type branched-subunit amino acid transport system ATPase component/ABC-type branched-subunit amino acid transport system permease subunit